MNTSSRPASTATPPRRAGAARHTRDARTAALPRHAQRSVLVDAELARRSRTCLGVAAVVGLAAPVATATAASAATTASASATSYTVRAGDTLTAIAARTGTTVTALVTANHLASANTIHVGQKLVLPTAATGAKTTSTKTTTTTTAKKTTTTTTTARNAALTTGSTSATATSTTTTSTSVATSFAGRTYATSVTAAATADKAALAAASVPSRTEMRALVASTARAMGVDPALAVAIAYQESGFNMRVVSPADAIGVMQVIPSSGAWASAMVGRTLDLRDPQDNVVAGVAILRSLVKSAPSTATAIAGYYQGLAGVLANGMYADTKAYVASVSALMVSYA